MFDCITFTLRAPLYTYYSKHFFTMVCFKCKKKSEPTATMKQRGAMVVVSQHCTTCGDNAFSWRSQPLSFGVLMAGASISKVLLVMRHMGLHGYSARTFFVHQKNFLFVVILNYWEQYRASLVGKCCLEWGWAV